MTAGPEGEAGGAPRRADTAPPPRREPSGRPATRDGGGDPEVGSPVPGLRAPGAPSPEPSRAPHPPPSPAWATPGGRASGADAWRLFVAFASLHLLFAVWPAIDLWVSALFFDGAGFPLRRSDALSVVRHVLWNATILVAVGSLAAWIVWAALGRRARMAPRALAYPAALAVLGPGLLVNGILKEHWGRARPADVEAFGGEDAFTPPFEIARECAGNCSFVSGEGAGAVAMAIGLGVLTPSPAARAALAAAAVTASALRVATGRHFLSDVVFGAFLMAFVAILLFRLMRIDPARRTLTRGNLAHDLGLLAAPFRRS